MLNYHVLSIMIMMPALGAALLSLFGYLCKGEPDDYKADYNTALWVAISTFLFSLILLYNFDISIKGFQYVEKFEWLEGYNIFYHVGVDGISLLFIILTTFLTPLCILCSRNVIKKKVKGYMIMFLLLESLLIGVFCSLDLIMFYVFFEAVLIPMFFIIGIWGGENRVYASFKLFLYTFAGSVFLLIAILYLYSKFGTTDIINLRDLSQSLDLGAQKWLWMAVFLSFAVKIPMWPFHTWLPDAHVQAPTSGSVILAGVLLKLGGYGFLRISLPLLPDASSYFSHFIFVISIIAIIYTSVIALMQKDIKKLIAYSSIAHMGFVTIGIFSLNIEGLQGSVMVMLSHGIVSAALFLCVGVLYNRLHTREISSYGGVVNFMPVFSFFFMVFTMASIGLPGTSGFVGELLSMVGLYKVSKFLTVLSATGVVLGAAYMLWLYSRVIFGEAVNPEVAKMPSLYSYEKIMFLPLVFFIIYIGIYPSFFTDIVSLSLDNILTQMHLTK